MFSSKRKFRLACLCIVSCLVTVDAKSQTSVTGSAGALLVSGQKIESRVLMAGQMLLPDLTSLTVSSDGDVVLDLYDYDPAHRSGEIAITIRYGALRLIGGKIPKSSDVVIRTPTATIRTRGSILAVVVDRDGDTSAIHAAGDYTRVEAAGEVLTLSRSNALATVAAGTAPVFEGVGERKDISRIYERTLIAHKDDLKTKNSGENATLLPVGATRSLTSDTSSGLTLNPGQSELDRSDLSGDLLMAVSSNSAEGQSSSNSSLPSLSAFISFTNSSSLTNGIFQTTEDVFVEIADNNSNNLLDFSGKRFGFPPFDPDFINGIPGDTEFTFNSAVISPPLSLPSPGARTVRTYELSDDIFLPEPTQSSPMFARLDLLGFNDASNAFETLSLIDAPGAAAKVVSAFLLVQGNGAEQTSAFGVFTGKVSGGLNAPLLFDGGFEGSTLGGGVPVLTRSQAGSVEEEKGFAAFGPDSNVFIVSTEGDPGQHFLADGAVLPFSTTSIALLTSNSTLPDEARMTLPAAQLTGYAAAGAFDVGSGNAYAARSLDAGGLSLTTDLTTNSSTASLILDHAIGRDEIGAGANADNQAVFRLEASFGGADGESAAIDDRRIALRGGPDGFTGAIATADLVGNGDVFPEGVTTTPAYLSWGWWAGEASVGAVPKCAGCQPSDVAQRVHLGSWIGGGRTRAANLPISGVATYTGFAAVSAVQNGVAFVDGAGFQMEWDFADKSGFAKFSDLLGSNATIDLDHTQRAGFRGTGNISIDGHRGTLNVDGSFFNGQNRDPAQAAAGSLGVETKDASIVATGVFGGERKK